ncbi:NlpC/P60 family protein, partial [Streptomyces sp. NPDC086669]|uniref:NlpC/P60 family protein n=1 Tax=Streptomyces sp. NPDC086669 TaxID=3365753 RepID=UPI00380AED68
ARFWTDTLPNFFKAGWDLIKSWVLYPVKTFFTSTVPGWGRTLRDRLVGAWDSTRDGLKAGWDGIKNRVLYPIRDFFTKTIPGWGTTLKNAIVGSFDLARKGIKTAWDKIKEIARKPVQYVVDVVYNKGILKVWNAVATAFGADPLDEVKFATGGIMPGYTPGRDVHSFVSPTGGRLALSGGEAIMRPEFTRAVGSGFVHGMNAIARSKGTSGVKAALAPVFGGNPSTPTDTTLRYADGGIFSWIGSAASKVAGAGSAVWNKIKEGASWLKDTLAESALSGVKNVVDPLLRSFPGMDTKFGQAIRRIPTKIIKSMFGYSKEADKKGGSGIGGPKIKAATRWAKAQAGKPYIWGGVGPKGFDCSGFMGAIENVIRGRKPNSRRWATGAFHGKTAPPGWVKNGKSAFRIGITNAGVGHTAGTLGKTKVESRGGDGVVVGSRARGYNSPLFTSWYGFKPGTYDSGGFLQPGLNLAYNGTGRPEPVLTGRQWDTLASSRGQQQPVVVELHAAEDGFGRLIDVRVRDRDAALVQVLNAG